MFTDRRVNDEAGPGENYEQHAGYEGLVVNRLSRDTTAWFLT